MLCSAKVIHPHANIHVAEILPSSSIHSNRVRGFNIYMNDIAAQHKVKVIHTWGSFIKGNAVDPGLYQDDYIHLSQKGVSTLALAIITQLHGRRDARSNGQDGFHRPPHLIDNEQSQTSQSGAQVNSRGQHTLPNGIVSNNRYYKVSSNISDRPVGQFNSLTTNTAITQQDGYPQITDMSLQNPQLANPAHTSSVPLFQGNGQSMNNNWT